MLPETRRRSGGSSITAAGAAAAAVVAARRRQWQQHHSGGCGGSAAEAVAARRRQRRQRIYSQINRHRDRVLPVVTERHACLGTESAGMGRHAASPGGPGVRRDASRRLLLRRWRRWQWRQRWQGANGSESGSAGGEDTGLHGGRRGACRIRVDTLVGARVRKLWSAPASELVPELNIFLLHK